MAVPANAQQLPQEPWSFIDEMYPSYTIFKDDGTIAVETFMSPFSFIAS